jgi:hypothetical protein
MFCRLLHWYLPYRNFLGFPDLVLKKLYNIEGSICGLILGTPAAFVWKAQEGQQKPTVYQNLNPELSEYETGIQSSSSQYLIIIFVVEDGSKCKT